MPRTFLSLLLLCGTALALSGAPAHAQAPGAVVINEMLYDPPPERDAGEYLELYNRSDRAVDLSTLEISDSRDERTPVTGEAVMLAPGGYAVLVQSGADFQQVFPNTDFVEPSTWPQLNNGGDTPTLYRMDGTVLDAVPYEPGWGGEDVALERIDPAGPSDQAGNFGSSTDPQGATPGAENSIFDRDTEAPQPVFAEAAASEKGAATIDVFFDEPLDRGSVSASDFSVGGQAPGAAALREDDTSVRLTFGTALDSAPVSVGGVRDLAGNRLERATVPISFVAAPGTGGPPGDLVINEILYDPLSDDFDNQPDAPEYFEIYNSGGRSFTLEGYYVTDAPNEEDVADTLGIGRARASVAPGGYAVAFAVPEDDGPPADAPLVESFPETDFDASSVTLLPVDRSSLGLTNDGGLIKLHRPDGAVIDSVHYRPDWQSQSLDEDKGFSLERIDAGGPSNAASNWTTSTAESGGTPGRANRAVLPPPEQQAQAGLDVVPSPFSPDGDGLDDVAAIRYQLDQAVSLARIRIYDSYGRQVYSDEARLAGRTGQVPWDGRSDAGERLRVGIYVVLFEALDAEGAQVDRFKEPVVLARPLN